MDDIDSDYIFRVVETRAREKLDTGQISQEEYEQIVQKHKHNSTTVVVNETEQASKALLLLVGDLLERDERAEMTGCGVLLGGSHGNSQIMGLAVLTNLRILFISEDAVTAAQDPNAVKLRSRVRVLPQTESFPLHSIQTTSWSKGTSSRMVKKSALEEGEAMVLEKAASWTVTITSKFGRTIQILFTETESVDNQSPQSTSTGAPQPTGFFCEALRERLHALLRNPSSVLERMNPVGSGDGSASSALPVDLDAWHKWRSYDPVSEFKRLGVDTSVCRGTNEQSNCGWSMTKLNEVYEVSATYPALLAVPSVCSIDVLLDAARFRSKGRIPSLSWRCTETGVTLSRCAQPLSGLRVYAGAGRNRSDEALVRGLWASSTAPVQTSQGGEAPHLILDCRPYRNAQANAVAGRGYENMAVYGARKAESADTKNSTYKEDGDGDSGRGSGVEEAAVAAANEKLRQGLITEAECLEILRLHQAFHGGIDAASVTIDITSDPTTGSTQNNRVVGNGPICELVFADIENIHVQRRCFRELLGGCNEIAIDNNRSELELGAVDVSSNDALSAQALSWLKHISSVLTAARGVVAAMRLDKRSVLVHCSDGWDRTPQITSLVSLLLDPYYRTINGFGVLIEKEWLSFGHAFAERMGHSHHKLKDTGHLSPIFYQWIDCVWQVTEQMPEQFEFDGRLLLALLDLMASCHFGNFLYNCERERVVNRVFEKTESVWDYVDAHRMDFENPLYIKRMNQIPTQDEGNENATTLFPVVNVKRLRLWTAFFQRWDASAKPKMLLSPGGGSELVMNPNMGATGMLVQRIAELERQLMEMQPKDENTPSTPTAVPSSRRYSNFSSQRLEGADTFTRRHCESFIGSVHGYAWTTITNKNEQEAPSVQDLEQSFADNNDESSSRFDNAKGRKASNVWIPDELAFKCAKCCISFTVFTRRHHCRGCGLCFCATCAPLRRVSLSLEPESTSDRSLSEEDLGGEDVVDGSPSLSKSSSKKERLCLTCYGMRTGAQGGTSKSFSRSLGKAMKGWSPLRRSLKPTKPPKRDPHQMPTHKEENVKPNEEEVSEDEGEGSEGAIMLDEFEADVDQRVSVLKSAELLEFLDPLTEFGFETIEDLLEPGLVNDEDLMSEFIGMSQEHVNRFRLAIGNYRRALNNFSSTSRMSGHFM